MRARSVRRLSVILVALVGALVLSSCGGSSNDAATLTFRDGKRTQTKHISRDQLDAQLRELIGIKALRQTLATNGYKQDAANGDTTDAKFSANWLYQRVLDATVDSELEQDRVQPTAAQKQAAISGTKQQFGNDIYNAMPKSLRDERTAENANFLAYLQGCPSGRLVEHILLPTKAAADAAFRQIKAGQQFADVARTKSIDTQSASLGGVLGCLTTNEFVPEFQSVAEQVPFDTVTVPVQSRFGYHLVLVRHWDPSILNSQIGQSMEQARLAARDASLKPCTPTSTGWCLDHVYIDPRYGQWEAQSSRQGGTVYVVTPPKSPQPRSKRD